MPQSNEPPAATVCGAERADVPDDTGKLPPVDRMLLPRAGEEVTAGAEDAAPDTAPTEEATAERASPDEARIEETTENARPEETPIEVPVAPWYTEPLPTGYVGPPLEIVTGREFPQLETGTPDDSGPEVGKGTGYKLPGVGGTMSPPRPSENTWGN